MIGAAALLGAALYGAGALVFGGGLRAELPDNPEVMGGLELDLRWFVLEEAYLGAQVGWTGGANDTNPERVLITQRIALDALLGARLGFDDRFGGLIGARAGVTRGEGFPRGNLPRVSAWGPAVGAEVGGYFSVGRAWGHQVWLEPRMGWTRARLEDRWYDLPFFGLALSGRLDEYAGE